MTTEDQQDEFNNRRGLGVGDKDPLEPPSPSPSIVGGAEEDDETSRPSFRPVEDPVASDPPTPSSAPFEFTFGPSSYNDDWFPSEEYGLLAPWTDPVNQDFLSDSVAISRDFRGGIFNALVDGDQWNEYRAPSGTRWALLPEGGKSAEESLCELRFCNWLDCFAQYNAKDMLNKPGVVHLVKEDLYYNIMFTNWTSAPDDSYYFRRLNEQPNKEDTMETRQAAQSRQEHTKQRRRGLLEEERAENNYNYNYNDWDDDCYYDDDGLYHCGEFGYSEHGGGFQYIRDEFPIALSQSECPRCSGSKATPSELTGPVDESFVEVNIEGASPDDVEIKILAVAQQSNPKCNRGIFEGTNQVRPNAKGVGNSTALLRRTLPVGSITAMRYTIFYSATNEVGTCRGQVAVCSPPEGLSCNDYYYGYDATSTRYCDGAYY